MLGVHLIPASAEWRPPHISREAMQTFFATELRDEFTWDTVYDIKRARTKVLDTAEEWDCIFDNLGLNPPPSFPRCRLRHTIQTRW
jgi:hypothetical protein